MEETIRSDRVDLAPPFKERLNVGLGRRAPRGMRSSETGQWPVAMGWMSALPNGSRLSCGRLARQRIYR